MAASKARRAQIAERRTQCVNLRVQGKSWDQIAADLGYKSRGAACQDFGRALKARLKDQDEAVDHLRELELERLDDLMRKAYEVLERPHLVVSSGEVVHIQREDGRQVPLRDDGPTLSAVDRLLRIAERRARLLGLDSPVRLDQTTTVRYQIEGVDMDALR